MKQRLYNALNIKPSESSQVFDLLSVQFFMGLANAFLNIVAFTLFIYEFNIKRLPWVYLAVALLLIVLNFFYEKLEHKFSPPFVLKTVIGGAIGLLAMLWIGLSFGNTHEFIFVLLVCNTAIYMVTGYAFWGLVALLFNVRESRRVFSVVGSGDIPSKFIGYLASPLLIPIIGLPNLVWLAIASLLISLYLFHKKMKKKSWEQLLKKTAHAHHHDAHEGSHGHQNIVSFFFENRLIFAISVLSVLSYNVFVLIDYTFISQVKMRYERISDLAVYIAVFFAIGRLIAMVLKLIFTSRVIERLGIIYCLFVTPAALFLFCMLFFFFDGYSDYNVYIFGLMALLTEVLRSTMQEPVFFILFQPLKEKLRLKGHLIAKGYTLPPSLIVVGLSLLLFFNFGFSLDIVFTIKIILANLVVWAAVVFLVQKAYLYTLHTSIEKGIFSADEKYMYDQKAIDILVNKATTGNSAEVVYALDLLGKASYPGIGALLHQQLKNSNSEVKKFALGQLEAHGKVDVHAIKEMLANETDAEAKEKAVAILCRHDDAYLNKMAATLHEQEYGTRKAVIISLLNQQEFDYLLNAGNEINSLINSPSPEERKLAISIISELKHVQFAKDIANLINDSDASVRRAAVAAACRLKIATLLPQILQRASHPEEKHLVMKALLQYGDKLYEDIKPLPRELTEAHTADLIKISGGIKGEHCKSFLVQALNCDGEQLNKAIHSLWAQGYSPGDEARQPLHQLLEKYLRRGLDKIEAYQHVHYSGHEKEIVKHSLINEIKTDLVLALKLCAMMHHRQRINRILELMDIERHQKIYNAIEMIELELPRKTAQALVSIFDFVLGPEEHKTTAAQEKANIFYKVYDDAAFSYNSWTKALVMYCSWKNKVEEDVSHIQPVPAQNEAFIVAETRGFVLGAKRSI